MNRSSSLSLQFGLFLLLATPLSYSAWGAQPTVQFRAPKDGSTITQELSYLLVSGKVANDASRSDNVDIFLVLDVSGSTAQYAGADFSELSQLPNAYVFNAKLGGLGLPCAGPNRPGAHNLRHSILAAEIIGSRRLLLQLNHETTRVGVISFGDEAWLRQPLTHNFAQVRSALDWIYKRGPYGGTNTESAIRLATQELLGRGESEKYIDSIKAVIFFTDGFPTRPNADCTSADTDLAITAAGLAGRAGISVHVLALGEEALSNPRAAVGIAKESGGSYTPVTRPADLVAVVDRVSAAKVEFLQVTNLTSGKEALQSRMAADGFFASAVPLMEGLNRIQVLARASDGSVGRDTITVLYEPGGNRSLELEIFLEKEKILKLEVERLGKSPDQIQSEADRNREEGVEKSSTLPLLTGDALR